MTPTTLLLQKPITPIKTQTFLKTVNIKIYPPAKVLNCAFNTKIFSDPAKLDCRGHNTFFEKNIPFYLLRLDNNDLSVIYREL